MRRMCFSLAVLACLIAVVGIGVWRAYFEWSSQQARPLPVVTRLATADPARQVAGYLNRVLDLAIRSTPPAQQRTMILTAACQAYSTVIRQVPTLAPDDANAAAAWYFGHAQAWYESLAKVRPGPGWTSFKTATRKACPSAHFVGGVSAG